MTLTSSGVYDLSLPDFDAALDRDEREQLLHACQTMAQAYAWAISVALELTTLCPRTCIASLLGSLLARAATGCQALPPRDDGAASLGTLGSIAVVASRALARTRQAIEPWCESWSAFDSDVLLEAPHRGALDMVAALAGEVRAFLDHTFQALGVGPAGLAGMDPFGILFANGHVPAFRHMPVPGQRWDVLRSILEDLSSRSPNGSGLRVAEVGVEKGMTASFLLRTLPAISEYVLVDPWHLPGKPDDFNHVLEGYHRNLEAWAASEPAFQRANASAARLLRMSSREAAGHFEDGYFDLVFIDAEHTFEEARRDITIWKRRVRPNGGVVSGHDFSLFHPAVSLAAMIECGPASDDFARFPLESEDGLPLLRVSSDSVWWCVRAAGQ